MKLAVVAIALVLGAAPAYACNEGLFSVLDWQASARQDGNYVRTDASADLKYTGEAGYRMIHAAVLFSDVLGDALVTIPLDRDARIAPDSTIKASGAFVGRDSRIATINRADVVIRTCVWSIVYEDGTVEKFE